MTDNPYTRWISSDLNLSKPVIAGDVLNRIPLIVGTRVFEMMGEGPLPKIMLDFEHLQVVDYTTFEGLTPGQQRKIAALHSSDLIRPEEMVFLALTSLFHFVWPKPESEDDLRYAASYHWVLNDVLVSQALELTGSFSKPDGLLPYWGRLAFLRVMSELPPEHIIRFGLDKVACVLVKKPKFNAMTIALDEGPLICMNYALEPILKHLNMFLLHFYDSADLAGPKRLPRAWNGILPTVLHFWSEVTATKIVKVPTMIFDEGIAATVHQMTADQIDFILMHEIGHVALNHPRRLKAELDSHRDATVLRHEFEFGADAFALGLMRSRFMEGARARAKQPHGEREPRDTDDDITALLHDYQRRLGSVYLLFTYMDFIQRAGELLRDRLGTSVRLNSRMDTHPRAADRLERLELINLGEYLYSSPIKRYAHDFLQSVLDYAENMDESELLDGVTAAIG
ncbi:MULTISPECIES: hypothetical protein [unclassified Rhizobium]|uniref:hypothetical protein n=1 Tax=unclassified Rhizobium TaxID=2613769 RepID=UPI000BDC6523|nr:MULTISPECIES: hypothetical protein [unclassified Rhizobium]MDH7806861.1 hypothetical protein [Rhizobium sp. AN67]MDQ4408143.1 hypothetical protein [Rhizobium sp. AN63]SOD57671.1 hypothetical protein SAMN05216595_3806 [Rhizobium sp. AN6A]